MGFRSTVGADADGACRGRMCDMKRFLLMLAAIAAAALLAACTPSGGDVSAGQTDRVSGFLFVSDTRPSTEALVEAMHGTQPPVRATYNFGSPVTLTDPQQIRELYVEMSGLILIGISSAPETPKGYFVEFELADGRVSRFDFAERTLLHVGNQYYMLESGSDFYNYVGA